LNDLDYQRKGEYEMGKATLTYYIFEGVLVGTVDGKTIHIWAKSGGGGGSTKGASAPDAVNNPYLTSQKLKVGIRGGPIPIGRYKIQRPAPWHRGLAARLEPEPPSHFQKRTGRGGGFLIHGSGPLGSDGCIVPTDKAEFLALINGLMKDNGGILTVLETMGGERFA
jgi:hypothetical protein